MSTFWDSEQERGLDPVEDQRAGLQEASLLAAFSRVWPGVLQGLLLCPTHNGPSSCFSSQIQAWAWHALSSSSRLFSPTKLPLQNPTYFLTPPFNFTRFMISLLLSY